MGNLGLSELVVIGIIALVVIGPRRLPEVARGLGEALRSFQEAMKGSSDKQRPSSKP
ncbi:MAG: twin-arginine translocase TatA/TatE family subunit [Candidatus Omnitrophica bacterium]|nr:twin-arginine translocase TatA/TatE family subunit [Candidatus Omnitrophota bacterium]